MLSGIRARERRSCARISLFIVAVFTRTLSLSFSLSQTLTFILSFLIRARGMCFANTVSERLYPSTCSIRIFDDDGEFLLVEASHLLPKWVEPNVAEGRTFIRGGMVRVVGDLGDLKDDVRSGKEPSRRVALQTDAEALSTLVSSTSSSSSSCSRDGNNNNNNKYRLGEAIDLYLKETKMKKYQTDEAILTSRHLARTLLPRCIGRALSSIGKEEDNNNNNNNNNNNTYTKQQTFIQTASRMFYERTPVDVRGSKDFRNLNLTTDDTSMHSATLRFSRCAYAQLARAKFDAPRKYPMDMISKTTDVDLHNAFDIGMKLVVGMEIALERLLHIDEDVVDEEEKTSVFNAEEIAAILTFKDALERQVEDGEDSESELLEPESDQWMRDGMLDLDNEILARAAERELYPLSEDEDAFDDEDLEYYTDERKEKEKVFSEDVKRVGEKLGTFMNAKATYKGAEEVHANKSYSKKIEPPPPPELDADAFERDLMNALMDDPELEQFLEQFTKDLAFNDEDLGASSLNAAKKVADDVQNELDLQAEDFDVAYEAALREQLLGSHVEESVIRTTTSANKEESNDDENMENETIKDVLKSAVMQNGQSGPASILLGTLEGSKK